MRERRPQTELEAPENKVARTASHENRFATAMPRAAAAPAPPAPEAQEITDD